MKQSPESLHDSLIEVPSGVRAKKVIAMIEVDDPLIKKAMTGRVNPTDEEKIVMGLKMTFVFLLLKKCVYCL